MKFLVVAVIALSSLVGCMRPGVDPTLVGRADQRLELFEDLVDKTLRREAFSPPKNAALNLDVEQALRACRPDFEAAADGHELYLALVRLSAARRDTHLRVYDPNPRLFGDEGFSGRLPLRFATDFGTPGQERIFVADLPRDPAACFPDQPLPALGDVVTEVHGQPVAEWVAAARPYLRASTEARLWYVLAAQLAQRSSQLPRALNPPQATLTLQRPDGTRYTLSSPWLAADSIRWQGLDQPRYPGFQQRWSCDTFTLYAHPDLPVLLLDWNGFGRTCVADTRRLVAEAAERNELDHAVIFDATRARGGAGGADVLRQLSPTPFRTTFGNLRISDVTPLFIAGIRDEMRRRQVGASWLSQWLDTDVTAAIEAGDAYSNNVPFKLAHLPKDADGIMQPAELHFRGPLVCLFSPAGGSHLDQFAAMVIDNKLAHTLGMPTGGYSNTWEWTEPVRLPGGPPLAKFMWSIGQTIRPNGEVLEGNPPAVSELLPPTRGNWPHYYDLLLERALLAIGMKQNQ